jgi:3-methyl-2-oxobutanoate hydroxymethyltransferase
MPYNSAAASPSHSPQPMTVPRFIQSKQAGRKLIVLTAYDYLWAGILDAAGVDAILVGDSLGMVVQGKSSTLPVRLREMIYHAEMVCRAVQNALVIVDLPFMSFQLGPRSAVRNAGRVLKETGAAAVKLEGGRQQSATIAALADADIPVMAHVGLKPQSIRRLGSYRVQRDVDQLVEDATAAEAGGAFAVVLECIPLEAAKAVTAAVRIPTIGIGAGPHCDGQVLVTQDMLGLTPSPGPKFVKQYADLRTRVNDAVRLFCSEVRSGSYPGPGHSYS